MNLCESCKNTDAAECIGCQGWRTGGVPNGDIPSSSEQEWKAFLEWQEELRRSLDGAQSKS